jgi:hypothetical protein
MLKMSRDIPKGLLKFDKIAIFHKKGLNTRKKVLLKE